MLLLVKDIERTWFDYIANLDRETHFSLMDEQYESKVINALNVPERKLLRAKADILERLRSIGSSIKLTSEVHHSSDEMHKNQQWFI